jgi:hypothetical protein
MEMKQLIDEVTLKLTGDIVDLELSDTALTKLCNSALRELQRYYDGTRLITIPFSKCIDMKEYNVNAVARIYRAEGYINTEVSGNHNSATIDPMQASQWQMLYGMGNINRMQDYAYNYASWNTLLQIRNTTSTDLAFRYDRASEKLYINIASNIPTSITIEYIPQLQDVSEIVSDFWNDVLVRLTIALTKVTVGRVRSKFKQSNALWVLDGEELLNEGNTELSALRDELKASTQLCYPID